jgi:hypothetical protein
MWSPKIAGSRTSARTGLLNKIVANVIRKSFAMTRIGFEERIRIRGETQWEDQVGGRRETAEAASFLGVMTGL